jgi:hypothetical protein
MADILSQEEIEALLSATDEDYEPRKSRPSNFYRNMSLYDLKKEELRKANYWMIGEGIYRPIKDGEREAQLKVLFPDDFAKDPEYCQDTEQFKHSAFAEDKYDDIEPLAAEMLKMMEEESESEPSLETKKDIDRLMKKEMQRAMEEEPFGKLQFVDNKDISEKIDKLSKMMKKQNKLLKLLIEELVA